MKRSEAIYLRSVVEQAAASLDDKTASTAVMLFPRLKGNGELVKAGVRIHWRGIVKKAAVDLWDRKENDPENAPGLWEDILYKNGHRIIPEVIPVTSAFAEGECGWWDGALYRSAVDANVYTPEQYPAHWEIVA